MVGFITREPIDHARLHSNLQVMEIFQKIGWINLFNKLDGYDHKIALDFSQKFEHM